jgi:hypothetical protein
MPLRAVFNQNRAIPSPSGARRIVGIGLAARRNKNAEEGVYLKLKKAKLKQLR